MDYKQAQIAPTRGIEADLSNVDAQVVRTERNSDGTFGTSSATDILRGIENLGATDANDRVVGGSGANQISTYAGDDYIDAMDGNDVIATGTGKDTVYGGGGDDLIYLEHNRVEIEVKTGTSSTQKFEVYADDEFVDGGAGVDFVSARFQTQGNIRKKDSGVLGDLASGLMHSWRNGDGSINDKSAKHTLVNIENLGGTEFGDTLRGDSSANTLVGYEGDDLLNGRGGNDTLAGGEGADTYEFGADWGQDVIVENAKSVSDVDVVSISSDISYADLWFGKQGDHLVVNQLGSSNQLVVQDWYSSDASKKAQIEEFRASFEGRTYVATLARVESLVNVMSAYSRPSSTIGATGSLTSAQKVVINSAISNAWQ